MSEKKLKICDVGHRYYKSSDCPTCPQCEALRKPSEGFLSLVSVPARRALEREGILSLEKLSSYSAKELLALHGVGPSAIPKLENALREVGLELIKGPSLG